MVSVKWVTSGCVRMGYGSGVKGRSELAGVLEKLGMHERRSDARSSIVHSPNSSYTSSLSHLVPRFMFLRLFPLARTPFHLGADRIVTKC